MCIHLRLDFPSFAPLLPFILAEDEDPPLTSERIECHMLRTSSRFIHCSLYSLNTSLDNVDPATRQMLMAIMEEDERHQIERRKLALQASNAEIANSTDFGYNFVQQALDFFILLVKILVPYNVN